MVTVPPDGEAGADAGVDQEDGDDDAEPDASATWSGLAREAEELREVFASMTGEEEGEADGGGGQRGHVQEGVVGS